MAETKVQSVQSVGLTGDYIHISGMTTINNSTYKVAMKLLCTVTSKKFETET